MIGPWQLGTSRRRVPFGDSYAHVDMEESKTRSTTQNMFKENSEWLPNGWTGAIAHTHPRGESNYEENIDHSSATTKSIRDKWLLSSKDS